MTELEKMLFIRARILQGNTKEQARREGNKQAQIDKLRTYSSFQFDNSGTKRGQHRF